MSIKVDKIDKIEQDIEIIKNDVFSLKQFRTGMESYQLVNSKNYEMENNRNEIDLNLLLFLDGNIKFITKYNKEYDILL